MRNLRDMTIAARSMSAVKTSASEWQAEMHSHKSGKLKQDNKKHKAPFASKRAVERGASGRVETTKSKFKATGLTIEQGRKNRQNNAAQIREQKKKELVIQRRLGGGIGVPQIVLFIEVGSTARSSFTRSQILALADEAILSDQSHLLGTPITASFNKFKHRSTLVAYPERNLLKCLDMAKAADAIVLSINMADGEENSVDEFGDLFVQCMKAQSMPAVMGVVQGLEMMNPKQYKDMLRYATRYFETEFGPDIKVCEASNKDRLLRTLVNLKPRDIAWRRMRAYGIAHTVDVIPNPLPPGADPSTETATVKLAGWVRGAPFNVHQLVHLPDVGTFQVDRVTVPEDPCPGWKRRGALNGIAYKEQMERAQSGVVFEDADGMYAKVLVVPTPDEGDFPEVAAVSVPAEREPLQRFAPGDDPLTGEQTWPSEQEMAEADEAGRRQRKTKFKVPAGMSETQAAWLAAVGELEEVTDDEADSANEEMSDEEEAHGGGDGGEAVDEDEEGGDEEGDDHEPTVEEMYAEKLKLAMDEIEFPDEMQTPDDVPARERFARYRGMKSMRTSEWDPKQLLPGSYSHIFQFPNWNRMQRRMTHLMSSVEKSLFKHEEGAWSVEKFARRSAASAAKRKNRELRSAASTASVGSKSTRSDSMDTDHSMDFSTGGVDNVPGRSRAGSIDNATAGTGASSATLLTDVGEGWVASGRYLNIHILNVPMQALNNRDHHMPLLFTSLLTHENRMSVVHFNVNRHGMYRMPIKSKEVFEFHVGFRKFKCRPVFSQESRGSDKHKFERYFTGNAWTIASVYAPISYGPMPVLIFKHLEEDPQLMEALERKRTGEAESEEVQKYLRRKKLTQEAAQIDEALDYVRPVNIVAQGMLHSVNPDRIVLKKVALSGYPHKVKKRTAVGKLMFFNPEDIKYFKPVELHTKYGLSGHIRDSIGTHGMMKCYFNKPIAQHDTIMMSLYKRVFPKWASEQQERLEDELAAPPAEVTGSGGIGGGFQFGQGYTLDSATGRVTAADGTVTEMDVEM